MDDKQGILLETGTNEFEIIEFTVGSVTYGINVAKVREVINMVPITKIANAHPAIDGIFKLRGNIVPLVNLPKRLNSPDPGDAAKIIVCEINKMIISFKVDAVSRIHRISWTQMDPAPAISGSELVVGVIKMQENLIVLLDFESILAEVSPEINRKLGTIPNSETNLVELRKTKTILMAEDSRMLRELVVNTLHNAGYNVIICEDGKLAWDKLTELAAKEKDDLKNKLHMIITDIEMPQMDGHHLIKRIKDNDMLNYLPTVIFSSLISPEMRRKGELIGANAQITKPEIGQLVDVVDNTILHA